MYSLRELRGLVRDIWCEQKRLCGARRPQPDVHCIFHYSKRVNLSPFPDTSLGTEYNRVTGAEHTSCHATEIQLHMFQVICEGVMRSAARGLTVSYYPKLESLFSGSYQCCTRLAKSLSQLLFLKIIRAAFLRQWDDRKTSSTTDKY